MATAPRSKRSKPPIGSSGVNSPRYEPVLDLPALPYEQYTALKDNIALNGVLVPILVDGDGPVRRIIDGNHRKGIADELGYVCPEVMKTGLTDQEMRLLARALNLARRQLDQAARRAIIADQLHETPERSNRWVGKQLGVHHATVASVRSALEVTGQIIQCSSRLGADNRTQPAYRTAAPGVAHGGVNPDRHDEAPGIAQALDLTDRMTGPDLRLSQAPRPMRVNIRPEAERQARLRSTTLIHGDCRAELKKLPDASVDAIITDPIYPEVSREYGRISEMDWHDLMQVVVAEGRRVLKPKGSMVIILQPNYEKVGQMRLWPWEFVTRAGREWNLVQDAYWWAVDAMPLAGTNRHQGLMRQSVKLCVWLGSPDCYRNQDNVLWTPSEMTSARNRADMALRESTIGRTYRNGQIAGAADERGGTTPFNLLPAPAGGPGEAGGHPAATPIDVAAWWCRYILPIGGVLLDPFSGSGTMLQAGLGHGASGVIGIERESRYMEVARRRISGE